MRSYVRIFTPIVATVAVLAFSFEKLVGQEAVKSKVEKTAYVTVADKYGRFISGLKKEGFTLKLDDFPQDISSFSNEDEVMTIGILVDKSGSQEKVDPSIRRAIFQFLSQSNPSNEYFINSFNTNQIEFLDFTQDEDKIRSAVKSMSDMSVSSETAVFDAIAAALTKLERARFKKRVLLVFSDFIDNSSKIKLKKLEEVAKRSDAQIYAVVMGSRADNSGALGLTSEDRTATLTRLSGGAMLIPSTQNELLEVCERISLRLRNQYKVGFAPIGKGGPVVDDKWHEFDVKVLFKPFRTADNKEDIKAIRVEAKPGLYVSQPNQ